MAKMHYRDGSVAVNAPNYLKNEWRKDTWFGTACGFIRKNTTYDINSVTCFYCKKKLRANNIF